MTSGTCAGGVTGGKKLQSSSPNDSMLWRQNAVNEDDESSDKSPATNVTTSTPFKEITDSTDFNVRKQKLQKHASTKDEKNAREQKENMSPEDWKYYLHKYSEISKEISSKNISIREYTEAKRKQDSIDNKKKKSSQSQDKRWWKC